MTPARFLPIVACLLASHCLPACAASLLGIGSGDTLTVLDKNQTVRIRLACIDAPEPRQPQAVQSARALKQLCAGKNIQYQTLFTNRQKQAIAIVHCHGVNINRQQVKTGMAWADGSCKEDPAFPALQEAARKARIGIWQSPIVIPPWEFRRKGITGSNNGATGSIK